ncbi:hypothetical protein ERJ70_15045 [Sediminibacillus dalangtanensis]|uniref:Uncharacterized protein n=1 Tax=Sediminibacillus dalangtanensis TaxID=2729421 RepID=A0ABX7VXY2_9BACI|nr:hypothetical protein [Sediminibacillus dalangtanensis]QTN00501.1 hypothetical protein ERJ70_15045 [Sediminibacillus dalangtanensis]
MYKKVNELITLLESNGKCEVKLINRDKHNYAIETMEKLPWKRHSKRFGKIRAGENRLRVDLEVPSDSISSKEMNNAIKLPHRQDLSHTRTSHFGLTQNEKGYDTVVIQIYRKDLDDFSFEDEPFASLVNKVIDLNSAE